MAPMLSPVRMMGLQPKKSSTRQLCSHFDAQARRQPLDPVPRARLPRALRRGGEGRLPLRRIPVSLRVGRRRTIAARARDAGRARWCCTTCRPGDFAKGERGIACLPGREREFREGVERAIEYAKAVGCPRLNCLAGLAPASTREHFDGAGRRTCATPRASSAPPGCSCTLEPINTRTVPGFFLSRSAQAIDVLNAAGEGNAFLQYDFFHMQIMEGDLAKTIERLLPRIGHIQLADVPGRHEPGSGEINFDFLLRHLDALGYSGWVGCEYNPQGDTVRRPEVGAALPVRSSEVAARAFLPGARGAPRGRRHPAVRMRRPHRLPPAADGGRAARDRGAGAAHPRRPAARWSVPVVPRGAGTGLSGGALPPGDGVLLSMAKFMRVLRDRPAGARRAWCSPACATSRSPKRAAPLRPVLRARSVEPDRLHHRRQRRRELRRRALPQVRPHACTTCSRVRGFTIDGEPVELGGEALDAPGYDLLALADRLRGHAGGDHRGDGEAAAEAAVRARASWRRSTTSRRRATRWPTSSPPGIIPAGPGDDGPAGDARGRAVRARRLRPRRRGDPAVRVRRHAARRSTTRSRA